MSAPSLSPDDLAQIAQFMAFYVPCAVFFGAYVGSFSADLTDFAMRRWCLAYRRFLRLRRRLFWGRA